MQLESAIAVPRYLISIVEWAFPTFSQSETAVRFVVVARAFTFAWYQASFQVIVKKEPLQYGYVCRKTEFTV